MSEALIGTTDLCHSFPNRGRILDHVNFQLFAGERVALSGQNGAGKSTFLQLLVGLIKLQQGQLNAFGQLRLREADFVEVRAKSGLLFQDPDDQLFSPTVLEDVAFGPLNLGLSRDEAIRVSTETLELLGMVGFEERITHQLSGGEKRMIALASVLAMKPQVLLLDEPSNALDNQARDRLLSTLQSLPQAMIIISHDTAFLEPLVNRWITLEKGEFFETAPLPSSR